MTRLPYWRREDQGIRRERMAGFRYLRLLSIGFVLLAMILVAAPSHASVMIKAQPDEPIATGGVFNYQLSQDSQYAIYLADQDQDQFYELYSLHLEEGILVQLGAAEEANARGLRVKISTDSRYVVYQLGTSDIFSIPITGGQAIKLNDEQQDTDDFLISPNNRYVVYSGFSLTNGYRWYSVPITGGKPTSLGDSGLSESIVISSDSQHVVANANFGELYSIPITGGTPIILNLDLPPGPRFGYTGFRISPDDSKVVFFAGQNTDEVGLFSVPIIGGEPTRISALAAEQESVIESFKITPDGNYVVYILQQPEQKRQLFRASLNGAPPIQLDSPEGSYIWNFGISKDSMHVYYQAFDFVDETTKFYTVPMSGNGPSTLIDTGTFGSENSPDGQQLIYQADREASGITELYSVPTGGGTSIKLNHTLEPDRRVITSRITPNGKSVIYGSGIGAGPFPEMEALYQVPLQGGTPTKIVKAQSILGFTISPDNRYIVFTADQNSDGIRELYQQPLNNN